MNTVTTFEPAMRDAVTKTDEIDDSFPYVLASSLLGTLLSLASVWIATAAAYAPAMVA